jgi:hypothetical protein
MGLTLSRIALDASCAAICALLDGGTLELYAGDRARLVVLTFGHPAFDTLGDAGAEAAPMTPGFGVGTGTPDLVQCRTATGDLVAAGPVHGLTIRPATIVPGARVTVAGLTLRGQS